MTSKFIYPESLLPKRFRYPEAFVTISDAGIQVPTIHPWFFFDAESKVGKLFYSIRQHDGRNLIPFAQVQNGDGDIACFDGDDRTGNPAVLILITDKSDRRYGFANFDDWFSAALEYSVKFKTDRRPISDYLKK